MAKIFLSYSKRDHMLAEGVANALRGEGLTVWWDKQITPREGWDRAIEREIASADHVLALWTRNSVESDWVRIEANYARNCRPSKLVQARFDDSQVPIAFSLIQFVELDRGNPAQSAEWERLVGWLEVPRIGSAEDKPAAPIPAPRHPGKPSARPRAAVAVAGFAWSDLALFAGPLLYLAGFAVVLSLREANPGEDYDLFGVPPTVYLTFLFATPYVLANRLRLLDILLMMVGIPAAHGAAHAAAAVVVSLLAGIAASFESSFVAGAVGGLVGAALAFALLLTTRPHAPSGYAWRQATIAMLFLPLVGGGGLYLALAGGGQNILGWALLYLPWQLMFALYLLKVLKDEPCTAPPAAVAS